MREQSSSVCVCAVAYVPQAQESPGLRQGRAGTGEGVSKLKEDPLSARSKQHRAEIEDSGTGGGRGGGDTTMDGSEPNLETW